MPKCKWCGKVFATAEGYNRAMCSEECHNDPKRMEKDRLFLSKLEKPENQMRKFVVMTWDGSTYLFYFVEARSTTGAFQVVNDDDSYDRKSDEEAIAAWTPKELHQIARNASENEADLIEKEVK